MSDWSAQHSGVSSALAGCVHPIFLSNVTNISLQTGHDHARRRGLQQRQLVLGREPNHRRPQWYHSPMAFGRHVRSYHGCLVLRR